MSKHTDAADAIRRMAKQYEQMVVAADILDQIGSLDNAAKEAQAVATAMQAEVATAKEELAKAKADIKAAKAKAEDTLMLTCPCLP
jgi:peptidoglycan hydrolase CwlO-like protein